MGKRISGIYSTASLRCSTCCLMLRDKWCSFPPTQACHFCFHREVNETEWHLHWLIVTKVSIESSDISAVASLRVQAQSADADALCIARTNKLSISRSQSAEESSDERSNTRDKWP